MLGAFVIVDSGVGLEGFVVSFGLQPHIFRIRMIDSSLIWLQNVQINYSISIQSLIAF